jgi:hypothetical protein
MGNSCSCYNFCRTETEVEPVKDLNPIPTGKQIKYLILKDINMPGEQEKINKIIKIQSHFRGMGMRDKIKLRIKQKNNKTSDKNSKKSDFNYENTISQRIEEYDTEMQKKYNEIIVNHIY